MSESKIQCAVRCPKCGAPSRVRHRISYVAEALMLSNPIRLHAPCHDIWWDASFMEREQIRQCLVEMRQPPGAEAASRRATA